MRKILSIVAVMALITTMLSSGALAQGSKEQKDGTGAGRGQEQSNRQNAPGHNQAEQDKGRGRGPADDDTQKPSDLDEKEKDWKNPNQDTEDLGTADTGDTGTEPEGDGDGTAPDDKGKPARDDERHEPKGRLKNIQAVMDAIGKLTNADTAAQFDTLLAAYQNAADETAAKTALTALLDALAQAGVQVDPESGSGDVQDQPFVRMNIERLRENVLKHAGNSNGTLLALLHAYENALRFKDHPEDAGDADDGTGDDSEADQSGTGTGDGAGLDDAVEQLNDALDSLG